MPISHAHFDGDGPVLMEGVKGQSLVDSAG